MSPQEKSLHDVRRLAGAELSLKARLGYVGLLLAATGMTVVIGSLWLTEPFLPLRTQLAFGVMTSIGVSWSAFSIWVLGTRRVLFARDRVIAGRMAIAFTSLFLAGTVAAVVVAGNTAAYCALATGAVMWAGAIRTLVAARRRFEELLLRRAELEGGQPLA
jgi:hypothetical protein